MVLFKFFKIYPMDYFTLINLQLKCNGYIKQIKLS